MRITLIPAILLILAGLALAACQRGNSPVKITYFVTVDSTGFKIGSADYYYLGTNFWYGVNLGSAGAGGNRQRLARELDRLRQLGVTNLRIMAGSEGPDTQPYRMVPALQTAPGQYNPQVLEGLDYLLKEMQARNMRAILCLSNFWNWSGGFGQYIVWIGAADSIPYPPPHPGGDWARYQEFTSEFYSNPKAMNLLNDHITFMVNRINTLTSIAYKDDPTIMAWQLCNEPRGINNRAAYKQWISNASALIKTLDPNHLVTIGSEGKTSSDYAGTDPAGDHQFKSIDYMTMHLWVQNWGVYDPFKADSTIEPATAYALDYIRTHEAIARRFGKPLVMEEFGISRDGNRHDAGSSIATRDRYYQRVFEEIYMQASKPGSVIAGCNFWAWAGEGRPRVPENIWKAGDDFIGDPPHETQGWYSVYDTDTTTQAIIKDYAAKMETLNGH